jgi:uncharacterized protein (UPF0147 family)
MAKPKRYGTRKSKRRITKRHHRKTIRARGGGIKISNMIVFPWNRNYKERNYQLFIEAKNNKLEEVRRLLEERADPDHEYPNFHKDQYNGKEPTTALLYAIKHRNADMVAILLDNGADPNFPKHNKPLSYAYAIERTTDEKRQDIHDLLVNKGATLT